MGQQASNALLGDAKHLGIKHFALLASLLANVCCWLRGRPAAAYAVTSTFWSAPNFNNSSTVPCHRLVT